MKKILLYWNHICILHNEEKKFLFITQEKLKQQGIDLEIKFFGLGYGQHMCEYLLTPNAIIPDMIVSADLEVFECNPIFEKLRCLHECLHWHPLRENDLVSKVIRKPELLPILAIPLVCYTNGITTLENSSILDLNTSLSFGGINNSAGKTLIKAILELYGEEAAINLLKNSNITDMPIGAFQSVRLKESNVALIPSLYALRADNIKTFKTTFQEGTLLLPSYFTCSKDIDASLAQKVLACLFNQEFCNMYATNGDLIVCLDYDVPQKSIDTTFVVSQDFLNTIDSKFFYDLYTQYIPTAKKLI